MIKTKKNKKTKSNADALSVHIQRMYNKSAPLLLFEAILFGAVAIFMLIKPLEILTVLTFIIGIALAVFGLYRMISGFVTSREIGGGWLDVLFGIVNVVLGILFCINPAGSLKSVIYIFLILFAFKALRTLIFAINMVRARFGHYWFDLLMALLLVGIAVFLLFYPLLGAVVAVYYLAIALLLYAFADIYMYIELLRLKNMVD